PEIVAEMQARGEEPEKDPFGHVKIDTINPGQWFAKQFAEKLGAEKVMVQKSGYFSRSAKANPEDIRLIKSMTDYAVQVALEGGSGLIGHDEERGDVLRAVEFDRVAGHKAFDISQPWFEIGEARRREGHGPEVGLLLPLREGEPRGHPPDQVDDRLRGAGRPRGRLGPHRPRRGARGRAACGRVRPRRRAQGLRHLPALV